MPKMRGFKAEVWTDDKFVELTMPARLLFMGMWSYACDNGHLDDKPKQIKMRVLPTDDVDPAALLNEMVSLGMVTRDESGLTIPKLREHQRIDDRYFTWCDRCSPDEIPEKSRERHAAATMGARRAHAVSTSDAHVEGRKEGRKEGEGESEGAHAGKPANPPRKKPAVRLPDDWKPTEAHWERRHDSLDIEREAQRFRLHAEANDRRQVNWNAAFSQWLMNARPEPANVRRLPSGEDPNAWMRRTL